MRKTILMASLGLMLSFTPAFALIPNGDFETGDLTGYRVQEDLADVPSSSLVSNVNDGTGNRVGELNTGFSSNGVSISSLVNDFGTLPADVQDLFFDVKFFDVGTDNPPIFALADSPEFLALEVLDPDMFYVGIGTPDGLAGTNLFKLTASGYTAAPGTEVEALSNGFYRVKTNVSGLAGSNRSLFMDLYDGDDQRLSKVHVDNIDLTAANQAVAPEPASMLLIGGGLMGFGYLRKKKLV
jgi:hypothetical protein